MRKNLFQAFVFVSLALLSQATGFGVSKVFAGPNESATVTQLSAAAGSVTLKFTWKTASNGPYTLCYYIDVNNVRYVTHNATVANNSTGSATITVPGLSTNDHVYAYIFLLDDDDQVAGEDEYNYTAP